MRLLWMVLVLCCVTACTPARRMEAVAPGDTAVGDRLVLTMVGPWNKVSSQGPARIWTMDGLPVDQLLVYAGVKDGQPINVVPRGSQAQPVNFRSAMQPDEIVAMFDGMLSRNGAFKLVKLEPAIFGGSKGLRFEYSLARKSDNVQLSGVGFAAVNEGELFAVIYLAPRLGFFARHQAEVEALARSAKISKGTPSQ